jgi:serine/threonine protein kinase
VGKLTQLRPGKEPFPGYRLRQLAGKGGFGVVWEAETADGTLIALKFLPCRDNLTAAQEIRAIQPISQLSHANLTPTYQVMAWEGHVVVAMELAEGSLLDLYEAYLQELGTPIEPAKVCRYLLQAAQGIDFLNARQHIHEGWRVGFQHCDIKPSNLLLFGETVKLCDYGLASMTSSTLRPHRRAGTKDYAAPEVFQGRLSDWTDQYSLAVTYCLLRGGAMPFPPVREKFESYVRPAPDLSMLPEAERPIIARALAPVPQDRWHSCRDLMTQLKRLIP